jgi:hypothetical protein
MFYFVFFQLKVLIPAPPIDPPTIDAPTINPPPIDAPYSLKSVIVGACVGAAIVYITKFFFTVKK